MELDRPIDRGKLTVPQYLKFIIPSTIGFLLFLTPIPRNGEITIGVGILAEYFQKLFDSYLVPIMIAVFFISSVFSVWAKVAKPQFILKNEFLKGLFDANIFWVTMRVLGFVFAILTFYQIGPEFIWADSTGGTVLNALVPVLTTWFFFAGFLLPFMLDFGLMEFVGTLVRKVMKPLFTLPGRSSIDCFASWLGSGTVGVLVTTKQYDEGYYSKREAAVIATNFSIASIAFSLVVINFIGLSHMFVQFYGTVVVAGVAAAIICPRIPPLSRKDDTYYEPIGKQIDETVPEGKSLFQWGVEKAVEKADQFKGIDQFIINGIKNVADIWFGLVPVVMSMGTLAIVIVEFTPIFKYMAYPLVPVLNVMHIPEASVAAQAMLVGFADMFLPAVVGAGIKSELTRFVIACISMTQLIYMSEVGALILRSNIPVSFKDLVVIFLERTIITLPIIVLMAHVFFF